MQKTIVLPDLRPLSVNGMYIRHAGGVCKSGKASDWAYEMFSGLSSKENQEALAELRAAFSPENHYYKFTIIVAYSKADLFTKKGLISARTQDCSNFEKAIIDAICLPKHHVELPPRGCPNLNMDDRAIVEMRSLKALSKNGRPAIIVDIEIAPLDSILTVDI